MANSSPWGRRGRPNGYHGRLPEDPAPPCPNCGNRLEGYTSVKLDGAVMTAGATSLCLECGVLLRYFGPPLGFARIEGDALIMARGHPLVRAMEQFYRLKCQLEGGNVVPFPNRQQRRAAARRG